VLALDIRRPFQREKEREKNWEFGFCFDSLNILWKTEIGEKKEEGSCGSEVKAVITGVEYWESLDMKKKKICRGNNS
jgi:hypothetical protein